MVWRNFCRITVSDCNSVQFPHCVLNKINYRLVFDYSKVTINEWKQSLSLLCKVLNYLVLWKDNCSNLNQSLAFARLAPYCFENYVLDYVLTHYTSENRIEIYEITYKKTKHVENISLWFHKFFTSLCIAQKLMSFVCFT